jgi:integrase
MFRRSGPSTLGDYARRGYSLLRDVKPGTLRQYVIVADLVERWAGRPVRLDELDEASVSEWLRDYSATVKPHTVKGKKSMLLALWRAASDDGLASEPTARRVRRVRVPELVPTAWTKAEVEQLLATVARLPRRHRCGLRRSVWWDLAVRVAWDSGLRWGDLVALRVDQIGQDGTVSITQSKTAKVSTFRLSPTTLDALRTTLAACPRDLVCPWPASGETFRDQFGLIVQKAGIRAGTWRWIRRGSGSDVEQQLEGAGHRHLGNTRAVFDRSYGDPTIIGRTTPAPRELLVRALSCENREKAGGGGQSRKPPPDSVRRRVG